MNRHACALCLMFVALLTIIVASGCAATSDTKRGTSITEVQLDLGMPDAISDHSGDLARYYVPRNRPPEEWPADAPRTFYYLDRNRQIVFINGRAKSATPIDPDVRAMVLDLIERRQADNPGD